jgi:hypothetical protein
VKEIKERQYYKAKCCLLCDFLIANKIRSSWNVQKEWENYLFYSTFTWENIMQPLKIIMMKIFIATWKYLQLHVKYKIGCKILFTLWFPQYKYVCSLK